MYFFGRNRVVRFFYYGLSTEAHDGKKVNQLAISSVSLREMMKY